jgi:molecular chaperone HscB
MSAPSTTAKASASCWSCSAATDGAHFCPACGKIQPLPPGTDYFAFFGLPRKLVLDAAALEHRFLSLSWTLHPDLFARASESERRLSLERSSQLNDAYRTLCEPLGRIEYLLRLSGMRNQGQQKQQAPPGLLEEVFELNESLDELRGARQSGGSAADLAGLRTKLEAAKRKFEFLLAGVDEELVRVSEEWDRAVDAGADDDARKKLMEKMNGILNRQSYFGSLVESTRKELASDWGNSWGVPLESTWAPPTA